MLRPLPLQRPMQLPRPFCASRLIHLHMPAETNTGLYHSCAQPPSMASVSIANRLFWAFPPIPATCAGVWPSDAHPPFISC